MLSNNLGAFAVKLLSALGADDFGRRMGSLHALLSNGLKAIRASFLTISLADSHGRRCFAFWGRHEFSCLMAFLSKGRSDQNGA